MAARAGEAHMGPLMLPNGAGTLTAADRDTTWQQFQVSASVRWRAQWGERRLSLSGLQMIAAHGTEGGRAAPGPTQQEFQQLERQAAAMQQHLTHQQGLLQWLQVQLQKAEQNAAAAYHESLKAKDEAEAAKDEAKKAVSDMEQHMARRRRKRKHYTIPCPKLAVAEALAEVHPTRIACPCKVYAGKWKQARSALILAKTAIA